MAAEENIVGNGKVIVLGIRRNSSVAWVLELAPRVGPLPAILPVLKLASGLTPIDIDGQPPMDIAMGYMTTHLTAKALVLICTLHSSPQPSAGSCFTVEDGTNGLPAGTVQANDAFARSLGFLFHATPGSLERNLLVGAREANNRQGHIHVIKIRAVAAAPSPSPSPSPPPPSAGQVLSATRASSGDTPGDLYGYSLGSLGDVNGDGVGDLAVHAQMESAGEVTKAGVLHLLFMRSNGTVGMARVIDGMGNDGGDFGAVQDREFGASPVLLQQPAGQQPHLPRLAVGVPGDEASGGEMAGAVIVLQLVPGNGSVVSHRWIRNSENGLGVGIISAGDRFGECLALPGDVDGDGFNDLIVGAPGDDQGGSDSGALHVLLMRANDTVRSTFKLHQALGGQLDALVGQQTAKVGETLAAMPPRDHELGNPVDIVMGEPNRRVVHLIALNKDGQVDQIDSIGPGEGGMPAEGVSDSGRWGSSVALAGDLDGDLIADVLVGDEDRSMVHVLYLASAQSSDSLKDFEVIDPANGAFAVLVSGSSGLRGLGVVLGIENGGGRAVIALGLPLDDSNGNNAGALVLAVVGGTHARPSPSPSPGPPGAPVAGGLTIANGRGGL